MAYQNIPARFQLPAPYPATALLGDADTTIQPFTDKVGLYILPAGTLTANRILTIGSTGGIVTWQIYIAVYDLSANTYTIKENGGGTLWTRPASPGRAIVYQPFCTNGPLWIVNAANYIVSV
jgi:hypothetical protein